MQIRFFYWLAVLLIASLACDASAKETQGKDAQDRDYWVYTPDRIDPEKTYTLVVGVHGYRGNGKGAGGYAKWVNQYDVIVLGASYKNDGYQYLQHGSDEQTLDLIKQLRQDFKLHDKIFIAGFSGGAQYAHRFAMKYPDLVAGCAAHSGGTWATGDYAERAVPNPKARGVLFVISCGEKDTRKSFGDAPMGRLEWAKKYETMLDEGGFVYDAKWVPDVGHRRSPTARQMTVDCFVASTRLLPELAAEAERVKALLGEEDDAAAWALLKPRVAQASEPPDGIIGKVVVRHVASQHKALDRIDRWAAQRVERALRDAPAADHRRERLAQWRDAYAGLARTERAIEKALSQSGQGPD
jgi:predicted esterase